MEVHGQLQAQAALPPSKESPVPTEWSPEEVLTLWKTDKPIFPRRQTEKDSLVSQSLT